MPARILYVNQSGVLTPATLPQVILPIQTASCEETNPVDDVLTLGKLTSLARIQNSVSTCKSDLKIYLDNTNGVNALTASLISTLTGESLAASGSVIRVGPNGFTMTGLLTSLSIEGQNGQFSMASMGFAGVGQPAFDAAPTQNSATVEVSTIGAISPVTTANISGDVGVGCANSIKFSLDIPTDVISCLGTNPSGSQAAVSGGYQICAKPPFKASIVVEGAGVAFTNITQHYCFGKIGINIPNPVLTNQSFNQAVGQVGATYSYTIEGVTANFITLT